MKSTLWIPLMMALSFSVGAAPARRVRVLVLDWSVDPVTGNRSLRLHETDLRRPTVPPPAPEREVHVLVGERLEKPATR